ncbi:hypothetical protein [Halomonas sp.]|uniref:hypothetical protein n=1 Tax=Halomonas sp. TaxID=1486246 RepID=UPI003569C525
MTRIELARWLVSLGWPKNEHPGFLVGAEPVCSEGDEAEELRALEAFGLLVELYASQHGPDYQYGTRPNASRVVKDMLGIMPKDVTKMGDRKLKEHVGAAIMAWKAKKRR